MIKTIAIVGAGFAGLSTGKLLRDLGYDVTIFEKEADVGGVWSASRRYPGLTTQNPGSTYALSDFPMPKDYPEWPTGAQMQAYFESYVDAFNLRPLLKLNTAITDASLNADETGWTLQTADGASASFDYLIVCNGIFCEPSIPAFDGAEDWQAAGGTLIHTSQFTDLDASKDKHVLVIGYGKSSCDAAFATVGTSKSTTVIARSLLWKMPRKLAGILNYKHLLLTRLGEGLFPYIHLKGFDRFLHGVGRPIRNMMLASVEAVIRRQLKFKQTDLHPGKPLETIARSTVSLSTEGFYDAVASGQLKVKKNTQIAKLTPGQAELSNGETVPADIIICGTGWNQSVPFFKPDLMARITETSGDFRLYRSMLPVDVPRLAFNGYNSSFFSQLNCEVGAMWIAEYLRGAITIPTKEEQNRDIDARLAWMRARTDGKHAKGTNIIPFSIHHVDELLDEINANVGPITRAVQWLKAIDPTVYAPIYEELKRRVRATAPLQSPQHHQYDSQAAE
ncbi:MAG: NAD(P)/FAD-dependent oxidoreductase [Pseudomonadota bacterium]